MKYLNIMKKSDKKKKKSHHKISSVDLKDFDLCYFLLNREKRT